MHNTQDISQICDLLISIEKKKKLRLGLTLIVIGFMLQALANL